MTGDDIIAALALAPHPEGGHYRQVYAAADQLPETGLPARYDGPRAAATAIYFLLRAGERSHLHRLRSDEIWHFYRGAPVCVHVISPDGVYRTHRLGPDLAAGERPQLVVPHGHWFAAEPLTETGYALVGNTVAPGFDFADFELAEASALGQCFPDLAERIKPLCSH
ncbi:cupin domain-containing protein [Salinisphaera sp. Q1T1-3]|uniref:cupin domain-containing protein n=1 Tax=Salinisphaera sp. Q1T1-3 TaxID=2321229 RepID=UPI000E73B0CA|nr:cupin domain-containing protein [Salinisphaera sp. Q1T1-3]RJS94112.1 cupin domain-containing protein [Salinisphaera sp. Q1T1-3]